MYKKVKNTQPKSDTKVSDNAIKIVYTDNLFWDLLRTKRQLGMFLTIGELTSMINNDLSKFGINVSIVIPKKKKWYRRVIEWFKNIQ